MRLCSKVEPAGRYLTPRASDRRFSRLLAGSGGPSSRCSLRRKSCVRISRGSEFESFNSTRQTAGFDGNAEKNSSSAAASNAREKSSSNTCSEYYDSIIKNGHAKASFPGQSAFPCTLIPRGNLESTLRPSNAAADNFKIIQTRTVRTPEILL